MALAASKSKACSTPQHKTFTFTCDEQDIDETVVMKEGDTIQKAFQRAFEDRSEITFDNVSHVFLYNAETNRDMKIEARFCDKKRLFDYAGSPDTFPRKVFRVVLKDEGSV